MASTHARALPRPRISATVVDALVGAFAMLVVAAMTLLTPAFTDYEQEIEPTLHALLRGDLHAVAELIPIYGGSLALEAPFSALGWLVGGDMAMYRATAIPGAAAMLVLGTLAASWLRAVGRPRREQLGALVLIVASPCIAQAWAFGHHEEVLVSASVVGGILLLEQSGDRRLHLYLGAVLVGLACGGKLWPLALVPVALASTRTLGNAIRVGATVAATTAAMVVPNALAHLAFFKANVASVGGGGVFSQGNLWWFLGARNPDWADPRHTARAFHVMNASYREAPGWVTSIAHPLVVLVACVLSLAWWWRARHAAPGRAAAERTASLLFLVASVVWWRALLDGWYQPYYLTAAIVALALADARRGRFPVVAAVAWSALWVFNGQNNLTTNWSPDLVSAVSLAWTVPVGLWSTARALRSAE